MKEHICGEKETSVSGCDEWAPPGKRAQLSVVVYPVLENLALVSEPGTVFWAIKWSLLLQITFGMKCATSKQARLYALP